MVRIARLPAVSVAAVRELAAQRRTRALPLTGNQRTGGGQVVIALGHTVPPRSRGRGAGDAVLAAVAPLPLLVGLLIAP